MSSKTKIIVLHKKEVLYTIVFVIFAAVILGLLFYMFMGGSKKEESAPAASFTAGVYSSTIQLGGQSVDVEVSVDKDHINSIAFRHLDEAVSVMYPLMQPALEDLTDQILKNQSLDDISYPADSQYTSVVLLNAIKDALGKASTALPAPSARELRRHRLAS